MGRENVVHAPPLEGGAVPDVLSSENAPPSVLKRLRLRPLSHFQPFHGPWVPLQSCSMGALQLPTVALEFPYTPSVEADPRGLVVLRPDTGDTQTTSKGTPTE